MLNNMSRCYFADLLIWLFLFLFIVASFSCSSWRGCWQCYVFPTTKIAKKLPWSNSENIQICIREKYENIKKRDYVNQEKKWENKAHKNHRISIHNMITHGSNAKYGKTSVSFSNENSIPHLWNIQWHTDTTHSVFIVFHKNYFIDVNNNRSLLKFPGKTIRSCWWYCD